MNINKKYLFYKNDEIYVVEIVVIVKFIFKIICIFLGRFIIFWWDFKVVCFVIENSIYVILFIICVFLFIFDCYYV